MASKTADCGHTYEEPGPNDGASGYSVARDTGKTSCYACSNKAERAELASASKYTAYLAMVLQGRGAGRRPVVWDEYGSWDDRPYAALEVTWPCMGRGVPGPELKRREKTMQPIATYRDARGRLRLIQCVGDHAEPCPMVRHFEAAATLRRFYKGGAGSHPLPIRTRPGVHRDGRGLFYWRRLPAGAV